MPNKYLKEYVESKNNKELNYNEILSKVKGGNVMNIFKIRFVKLLATVGILLIVFVGIPNVYAYIKWNAEFTEFMEIPRQTSVGTKVDDELVEMNYIEKNGIKARVESLIASEDEVKIRLAFEFDNDIELNSKTFDYSYAVYDENNNIYAIYNSSMNAKIDRLPELIYRELNVDYNKNDIYANQYATSTSMGNISANNRKIVNEIRLKSLKGFPKSKKLYLRILNLGYSMINVEEKKIEEFNISKENWIFEIDIPERFYNSNSYDLKLKNEIEGVKLTKARITDTALTLTLEDKTIAEKLQNGHKMKSDEFAKMQDELIYITDNTGNKIQMLEITSSENEIKVRFSVAKQFLDENRLFINITKDGKTYKSELIKE
ncbi:MAG: hypothetical protein ILA02_07490 [Clostridia bacterium]|nr:hypothetical protein [Clostridia bacterium]